MKLEELLVRGRMSRRRAMYWEMQEIVRDEGGTIIPVYAQYVFASRSAPGRKPRRRWLEVDGTMVV